MKRLGIGIASLTVVAALSAGSAHAQNTRVVGVVKDRETQKVVESAKISWKSVDMGIELKAESNKKGQYRIPNVRFGNYEVTVEAEGYPTFTASYHVEARSNEATNVNVELGKGKTVVVAAER
ncbi:MAG: carboxypeptidase-like regulatory domain-containing protein [Acidobacteriota bacterium]